MASKVSTETEAPEDQAQATLVIGNSYTYRNTQFLANVPKPVSLELAEELEKLTLGSTDSRSKKTIAQHRFEIEWPEGYTGNQDEEAEEEASSGARRPAKKVIAKRPSRASK